MDCKLIFLAPLLIFIVVDAATNDIPFDLTYGVEYGSDHVSLLNQGKEAQIWLDANSGARFASKLTYGSGFFHMRVKLPSKDSAGVVTAFYLSSYSNNHDELDFEFLGNKEGKPITLQTNVFVNGKGDREQKMHLWFDPTADFHTYKILWNTHQTTFYVDNIPIRVFKNCTNIGCDYPTQPMKVLGSIWNGDSWATDGGHTKINWAAAPFTAHYQGFNIVGCPSNGQDCYDSEKYWWNKSKYWKLPHKKQKQYENVRKNFLKYDYCNDRVKHYTPPPECAVN